MKYAHYKGERGFIALTSTLILTIVLVLLVYSTSSGSFYARSSALSSEYKRISMGLSESCTNAALLKIAQNYNYAPPFGGETVAVGPDTCVIRKVVHDTEDPVTHRKNVTIYTGSRYPNIGGSWSTTKITATVQNPTVSVTQPPPSCALQVTPTTVQAGQPITVQWASSANTASFALTPTPSPAINNPADALSGTRTFTIASAGDVQFTGTATNAYGTSAQCGPVTVHITPPPPSPSCADTTMIFDRTGSMNSTDRANEKSAGTQLINLYASVPTFPKVSVGSFGGLTSGMWAEIPNAPPGTAPTGGLLSFNYGALIATLNTITGGTSSGGSDLGQGIEVARQELDSIRSTKPQKVIVFVSDGEANHASPGGACSTSDATQSFLCRADYAKQYFGVDGAGKQKLQIFTVYYSHVVNAAARALLAQVATDSDDDSNATASTGAQGPTRAIGTAPNNKWTNASNAFTNDSTFATDSISTDAQAYGDFNLSVPSGATVSSVDVIVDGVAGPGPVNSPNVVPNGIGSYDGWTLTGSTKASAVSTNDADTSRVSSPASPLGAAQTFAFSSPSIPVGSTINSVTVTVIASRTSTSVTQFAIRAENGNAVGQQSDGSTISIGSAANAYGSYSRVLTTNPLNAGAPWTTADIAATRFGVIKMNSTGTTRVTQLYITVNYTPVSAVGSCQLSADMSWNNGTNWSSAKSITLDTTESAKSAGGDTWGHTWTNGQFGNGSFLLRLTNGTCSSGTAASVNYMTVNVTYSSFDPTSENSDGDNFFITPDTSNAAAIQNIFDTIGKRVCPAAAQACANTVDDDGDGLVDAADPSCHVGDVLSGAYNASDNDEWTAPPIPAPPTAPLAPTGITIGSWDEIVSPNP